MAISVNCPDLGCPVDDRAPGFTPRKRPQTSTVDAPRWAFTVAIGQVVGHVGKRWQGTWNPIMKLSVLGSKPQAAHHIDNSPNPGCVHRLLTHTGHMFILSVLQALIGMPARLG
jgi:hypothetical protein